MQISETTFKKMPEHLKHLFEKLPNPGSDEVLACFPDTKSGTAVRRNSGGNTFGGTSAKPPMPDLGYADAGSAARFFYCPKASKRDRDEGLEDMERKASAASEFRPNHAEKAAQGEDGNPYGRWKPRQNNHPTVKPTELMRYLCRLVTPPGGVVLDPFMGSGSTGKGAMLEGFRFIGIERDPDYFEIACRRIEAAYKKEN